MKIDIQIIGQPIVKSGGKPGFCYIQGTNKWAEWAHHFLPGAGWRERRWGRQVAEIIHRSPEMIHTVGGHSVGGTVAIHAGDEVLKEGTVRTPVFRLFTYGPKRPSGRPMIFGKHYRIKGDPVPFLPPWRRALPVITLDYGELGPVEAHGPRSYYEQMREDGVR